MDMISNIDRSFPHLKPMRYTNPISSTFLWFRMRQNLHKLQSIYFLDLRHHKTIWLTMICLNLLKILSFILACESIEQYIISIKWK